MKWVALAVVCLALVAEAIDAEAEARIEEIKRNERAAFEAVKAELAGGPPALEAFHAQQKKGYPQLALKVGERVIKERGEVLNPTDAQARPLMKWDKKADKLYSVLIVNESPKFGGEKSFTHFAALNIPGKGLGQIPAENVLIPYVAPLPSPGDSQEFRVFVFEQQQGAIDMDTYRQPMTPAVRGDNLIVSILHSYKVVAYTDFLSSSDDYSKLILEKMQAWLQQQGKQPAGQPAAQPAAQQASSGAGDEDALFVLLQNGKRMIWQESYVPLAETEQHHPRVDWNAGVGKLYTVIMLEDTSADIPETPWLHWLVVDVPDTTVLAQGKTVCPYSPPEPSVDHRYIVAVIEQTGPAPSSNEFIRNFSGDASRASFQPTVLQGFLNGGVQGKSSFRVSWPDATEEQISQTANVGMAWAEQEIKRLGIDTNTFGQGARPVHSEL